MIHAAAVLSSYKMVDSLQDIGFTQSRTGSSRASNINTTTTKEPVVTCSAMSSAVRTAEPAKKVAVKIRKASEPFDGESTELTDLIIRSSDHVDFYVHRLVLSLSSPVFANMLTFPQPPGTDPQHPVVDVLEDSATLNVFLRICYPVPDPDIQTCSLIRNVLDAAMKYDAPAVVTAMKRALSQPHLLADNPLRVFALACFFGMEAETKAAAEKAVIANRVVGRICAELEEIPAGAYYRLLQLHRTRTVTKSKAPGTQRIAVDFTGIGPFCESPPSALPKPRAGIRSTTKLIAQPPFDAPNADLVLRSSDRVDFRVFQCIITLASPSMLQHSSVFLAEEPRVGLPPVYRVPEDSTVLEALLRTIYPAAKSCQHYPLDTLLALLAAAQKYGLEGTEQAVRETWPKHLKTASLRLYLASVRYGWTEEARACVDALLQAHDVPAIYQLYLPELETTVNRPYHRLLHYIEQCVKAAEGHHSLDVSGKVHPRSCSAGCGSRYPSVFSTAAPPAWLPSDVSFQSIAAALKDRPAGSTLAPDTKLAKGFILAAASDTPPCCKDTLEKSGGRVTISMSQSKCKPGDNVSWAYAVLQCYAQRVDAAVQNVRLPSLTPTEFL
ncbi:hypothetical protein BD413DRAFT_652585 [Trametes elegans]|nr:hypothetical protein BD413DRAFT_652585 [Trametes elegans]